MEETIKRAEIIVKRMNHETSQEIIKKEVGGIGGVKDVDVDTEHGLVIVSYDTQHATVGDIKRAIEASGYEVI